MEQTEPIRKHIEGKIVSNEEVKGGSWVRYDITIKNDKEEVNLTTFNKLQSEPYKEGAEVVCDYIVKHNGQYTNYNIERIVLKKDDNKPEDVLSPETLEKLDAIGKTIDERGKNLSDEETYKGAKKKCDDIEEKWDNILIVEGKKFRVVPF